MNAPAEKGGLTTSSDCREKGLMRSAKPRVSGPFDAGSRLGERRLVVGVMRRRDEWGPGDIVEVISEVIVVEQILIRNLPAGTKAALKARADQNGRSVEAEVREIVAAALARNPTTLVDLLAADDGADIAFEPQRLGLSFRPPEL